jgi:hypothetical protein
MYIFDHFSMTWREISSDIGGNPPLAKAYFKIEVANGKIYLFGGGNDAGIAIRPAKNRTFFVLLFFLFRISIRNIRCS